MGEGRYNVLLESTEIPTAAKLCGFRSNNLADVSAEVARLNKQFLPFLPDAKKRIAALATLSEKRGSEKAIRFAEAIQSEKLSDASKKFLRSKFPNPGATVKSVTNALTRLATLPTGNEPNLSLVYDNVRKAVAPLLTFDLHLEMIVDGLADLSKLKTRYEATDKKTHTPSVEAFLVTIFDSAKGALGKVNSKWTLD
jgi:hypothetical protein